MIDTPEITRTEARTAAVIHLTVPRREMQEAFGHAMDELMSTLEDQDIAPAGPVFAHHLTMDPETFDFELGVAVGEPVAATGRVEPGQLPVAKVVRTVYCGPYEGLPDAWGEFDDGMNDNGCVKGPTLWECYVEGPDSSPDPASWRTELYRPLVD